MELARTGRGSKGSRSVLLAKSVFGGLGHLGKKKHNMFSKEWCFGVAKNVIFLKMSGCLASGAPGLQKNTSPQNHFGSSLKSAAAGGLEAAHRGSIQKPTSGPKISWQLTGVADHGTSLDVAALWRQLI